MDGITRRGAVGAAAVALAGCLTGNGPEDAGNGEGNENGAGNGGESNPALASARGESDLTIGSLAFEDGAAIPRKYGREEADVNPPLEFSGAPDATESLVVVVDDPDAVDVAGEIFVHWLVWNVPPGTATIPEGWSPEAAVEGENDFGEVGYGGPAPPDEAHTYRFKCFALGTSLDLEAGATVEELGPAMSDEVLARAQLAGTYAP